MTAFIDNVTFGNSLLLIAIAGVLLLFARDWPVRLAGIVLILPRLMFAPLAFEGWLILGSGMAAAAGNLVYQWHREGSGGVGRRASVPDTPESDDVSEPAACLACGGVIPAGARRCPACSWSYAEPHKRP